MFFGIYMIMVFDPQILFNDGFYTSSTCASRRARCSSRSCPAALSCRTHALGRIFDILGGLLGQRQPEFLCAAGFSSSARTSCTRGYRRRRRVVSSSTRSASAASPAGRSATGRTGTRCGRRSPTCRTSSSRRTSRCASSRYETIADSGGPGLLPRRQRHRHRLPVPRAGRNLDPRRPLVHLSLGRQRRRAGHALAQVAGAHRRRHGGAAIQVRPRQGRAGRHAALRAPGAAAAGATRSRAIPSWSRWRSGAGWSPATGPALRRRCSPPTGRSTRPRPRACGRELAAERGGTEIFVRGPAIDELRERCLAETGLPAPRPPVFRRVTGAVLGGSPAASRR